ncbi:hypothetical protein BG74_02570 [Sodalis-like endosymbiont of Proechinophthirus fluctus]|nr:hypothetical protein BG74_02570 [Sodalis-like endosymbiont of Proechinophthirus fluctus]
MRTIKAIVEPIVYSIASLFCRKLDAFFAGNLMPSKRAIEFLEEIKRHEFATLLSAKTFRYQWRSQLVSAGGRNQRSMSSSCGIAVTQKWQINNEQNRRNEVLSGAIH